MRSAARRACTRPASPGPNATDEANNRRLLDRLGRHAAGKAHGPLRVPRDGGRSRRARFAPKATTFATAEFASSRPARNGFGYDPLFEVVEYHRTFGELGPHVKQAHQPPLAGPAGDCAEAASACS